VRVVNLTLLAVLTGLLSGGVSAAEKQSLSDSGAIGPSSATTAFTFAGNPIVALSNHGNLVRFEGPTGFDHIGVGAFSEGYVLCYGASRAWDTGSSESGFAAATFSCNTAKTSCTVTRNTADGKLSLKQVITRNSTDRSVSFNMTVTNRTGASISGVILRRQADPDVDTGGPSGTGDFTNWFGSTTFDSAWGWNAPNKISPPRGTHAVIISSVGRGPTAAKVTSDILDSTCSPTNIAADGPVEGDYGVTLEYQLGSIPGGGKKDKIIAKYTRN
jgi:hypothetical protein